MDNNAERAVLFWVNQQFLLYLNKNGNEIQYKLWDVQNDRNEVCGSIGIDSDQMPWYSLTDNYTIAAQFILKINCCQCDELRKVSLKVLQNYKGLCHDIGPMFFESKCHDIRFIDSSYHTLFFLLDHNYIEVAYGEEKYLYRCHYIDDYHTRIGNNVFHICQFAELMERNQRQYLPECEIVEDQVVWKIGHDKRLMMQACDCGYDYTIYAGEREVDGGIIDNISISMIQARTEILQLHELPSEVIMREEDTELF